MCYWRAALHHLMSFSVAMLLSMLASMELLCSKLCQHNSPTPIICYAHAMSYIATFLNLNCGQKHVTIFSWQNTLCSIEGMNTEHRNYYYAKDIATHKIVFSYLAHVAAYDETLHCQTK